MQIEQGADGASVRLTASTEAAKALLVDAQPRLLAEARAQGLTLRDATIDTRPAPAPATTTSPPQTVSAAPASAGGGTFGGAGGHGHGGTSGAFAQSQGERREPRPGSGWTPTFTSPGRRAAAAARPAGAAADLYA